MISIEETLDKSKLEYGKMELDDRTAIDKAIKEQCKTFKVTMITFINGDKITVKETIDFIGD